MNPICVYDFTCSKEHNGKDDIMKLLKLHCKKWCFQEENGESGYPHFQGRMSLKMKERIGTCIHKFPRFHLSPTSKENSDNVFYVTKEETRVDGPWKDTDKVIYIPRQIRDIETLYPWQQHIVDDRNVWNTRTINIVIDETGNHGKSILASYIGVHEIGRSLPYSNDFRDISRMVMGTESKSLYIIDIPRALKKEQMFQFFAGIEQLKNGYAFDDRYSFQEKYFDCPNIWIFMNKKPENNLLSKDRWKYWEINYNLELQRFKFQAAVPVTINLNLLAQPEQPTEEASRASRKEYLEKYCQKLSDDLLNEDD